MTGTDWGDANLRFLGLMSVGAARSLDQMALRPFFIKIICQTHNAHAKVSYLVTGTDWGDANLRFL